MVNYLNEILDTAKLEPLDINTMISYCCVGGKVIVVNNYIKIISYSPVAVVLKVKHDELVIEGSDIYIKELNKKDITLAGEITNVYFAREVKKNELQT